MSAKKLLDIHDLPVGNQEEVSSALDMSTFYKIRDLIFDLSGIHLADHKRLMVEARLSKRLRHFKLKSYEDYLYFLKNNKKELEHFVNALTTNKTEFFREASHFQYLVNNVLTQTAQKKHTGEFYVWSAASSTGEEIYTLSMVLEEFFEDHPGWDYRILGTDIDTNCLNKASEGVYPRAAIEELQPQLLQKYFECGTGKNTGFYRFKQQYRNKVKFRQHNLVQSEFPAPIKFDVIFLRNVLIYFEPPTVQIVIDFLMKKLKPGGVLFIGHSENLNSIRHDLIQVPGSIYRKP